MAWSLLYLLVRLTQFHNKLRLQRAPMPVSFVESRARQFQRILQLAFIVLVLANALTIGLRTVSDSDTGWHLATGRYVWQHHVIPRTDVLSYTSLGTPWVYPPFAGVLLYFVYSVAGYAGLSWFSAVTCLAIAAYLVRKKDLASSVLTLLALPSIAYRTAPRADLFTTAFFALFLGELWELHCGSRRRVWLLPVVMLLWVNFHPGFIAGLAIIGAYLFLDGTELLFASRRERAWQRLRSSSPWLIATCMATLINPWGYKIYSAALNLSGVSGASAGTLNSSLYIQEFWGLRISSQTFSQLLDFRHMESGNSWLLAISLVLIVLALLYKELAAAVIVAVTLYACLMHVRFLGMFAIAIVILGGTLITKAVRTADSALDSQPSSKPLWRPPVAVATVFTIVVSVVAFVHIVDYVSNRSYVVFGAPFRFGAGESSWFPSRAASFIEGEKLPGNIFEEFALGGFAAFRLGPAYPDFIDGRDDHLNPALFLEEQKLMHSGPDSPAWQAAVDRWEINALLVSTAGARALNGLDITAFCNSSAWRAVYMDEVSLVFMRNSPETRPWLDRLSIDCASRQFAPPESASRIELHDFYSNAAGLLFALHRDNEAAVETRRAAALFPQDPNAHFLLGRILYRQRKLTSAEEEYRRGLALKDDGGAWFELSMIFTQENRYAEAEQALEHSIRLSLQPLVPYMALARLELVMGQPAKAIAAFHDAEENSPYRHGGEGVAPELYAQIAEGRAQAYGLEGDRPRAIEQQRRAVELTPSSAGRWNKLSDLLQLDGQWQAALDARAKAQALSSSAPKN